MRYEVNLHAQKKVIVEAASPQAAVQQAEQTYRPFKVSSLVEDIPDATCFGVVGYCHRCECALIGGVVDYMKNNKEEMFCMKCALITLEYHERQTGQG